MSLLLALLVTLTARADLREQLTNALNDADYDPVVTVHLPVGERTLDVSGRLSFVGLPGLPDYFGLRDERGTLHVFKTDLVRVTIGAGRTAGLERGFTHLLECPADFGRVLNDEALRDHLRVHGFSPLVDRLTYASERRPLVQFVIWGGSAVAMLTYFVLLDAASELYVGRVGPRVLMDHLSSVLGSATMVSAGFIFTTNDERKNRIVSLSLASLATAAHFVIENPLGWPSLHAIRFNVADPVDFWAGAAAAFGTALVPDVLRGLDHARRWSDQRAQRRMCERALMNDDVHHEEHNDRANEGDDEIGVKH